MIEKNLSADLEYYQAQSRWTAALRAHLYRLMEIGTRHRALDVGCGGGWLTAELAQKVRESAIGCDTDPEMIAAAKIAYPSLKFVQNEPLHLPFNSGEFDLVVCHFSLLWAEDPVAMLTEMKRVTNTGGIVAAFAEPDWGGYFAWPDLGLGPLLCTALATLGADPYAGRKILSWFAQINLTAQIGITSGTATNEKTDLDAAWVHHRLTLKNMVSERKLRVIERKDREAAAEGARMTYLPLVWAIARR